MPENPGGRRDCLAPQVPPEAHSPATRAALARALRAHLADAVDRLGGGTRVLQRPAPASVTVSPVAAVPLATVIAVVDVTV